MPDSSFSINTDTTQLTSRDFLSDLKNKPIGEGITTFLVAKNIMGDNQGGFYRWDSTATGAEDTVYMNIIPSNLSSSGRWVRVFQKAKNYTHGTMVNAGGVKIFWAPGTTDANGLVTLYLTEDNTATGTPLFSEVWSTTCSSTTNISSSADALLCSLYSLSGNLKTLVYVISKGNQQTLGGTLLSILGLVITAFKTAPAGVTVQFKVEGI